MLAAISTSPSSEGAADADEDEDGADDAEDGDGKDAEDDDGEDGEEDAAGGALASSGWEVQAAQRSRIASSKDSERHITIPPCGGGGGGAFSF